MKYATPMLGLAIVLASIAVAAAADKTDCPPVKGHSYIVHYPCDKCLAVIALINDRTGKIVATWRRAGARCQVVE
jgi:hypothetical protein